MSNKIVVVKASWCGPCKAYAPVVESAKEDLKAKGFEVEFLDADENREFCDKHGIRGVPSTVIFKQDEVKVVVGSRTKEQLLAEV